MDGVILVIKKGLFDHSGILPGGGLGDLHYHQDHGADQEETVADDVENVVDPAQGQDIEDKTAAEEKSWQVGSDLLSGEGQVYGNASSCGLFLFGLANLEPSRR